MKILQLNTYYSGEDCTLGAICDGDFVLYTLENPWKDNQRSISCIPSGVYVVRPFTGGEFHDVWKLENVHNRSAILIHYGNTAKNTEGCILIGLSAGELSKEKAVLNSRNACAKLTDYVGIAEAFILIVRRLDGV
jgi:hypothetical protein